MIDVDALLAESANETTRHCKTCKWLASRPEDERRKWVIALEQPKTWSGAQVARAMALVPRLDGAPEAPQSGSVQNHRTGHVRGRGGNP